MLSRNHLEINLRYFCPITQQVMVDPVFTSDGYTYEREAISIWLQANNISPMTGLVLEGKKLTPNLDKRSEIQEWLIDNPAAYQRGVVYLPQDWILHIANELRHWNINTNLPNLLKYLDKDDRLLTIPLWQDYTLIHLAAEFTSLEFTELILNKLIFTNHPICFNSSK